MHTYRLTTLPGGRVYDVSIQTPVPLTDAQVQQVAFMAHIERGNAATWVKSFNIPGQTRRAQVMSWGND